MVTLIQCADKCTFLALSLHTLQRQSIQLTNRTSWQVLQFVFVGSQQVRHHDGVQPISDDQQDRRVAAV